MNTRDYLTLYLDISIETQYGWCCYLVYCTGLQSDSSFKDMNFTDNFVM